MEEFMKKIMLLSLLSLFIMIIAGCADCTHERDYDYVGVTFNDFMSKSGITYESSNECSSALLENTSCTAVLNNTNKYGIKQGFVITCGNKRFNLQETIHTLFPQEAYKDDKFESCEDYYVYDFIADRHRSEYPEAITSVKVNSTDPNIWYVSIDNICNQWNVSGTPYDMSK